MIVTSASPASSTASTYSRCSLLSGVSSSTRVMPMTPFIGSRISWLMVARNRDFASFAAAPRHASAQNGQFAPQGIEAAAPAQAAAGVPGTSARSGDMVPFRASKARLVWR